MLAYDSLLSLDNRNNLLITTMFRDMNYLLLMSGDRSYKSCNLNHENSMVDITIV